MEKKNQQAVNSARNQFYRLKHSNLSEQQLLDDLQDLRDDLRNKYQMSEFNIKKYESIQERLNKLIDQIDKYWWKLFTKDGAANE